MSIWTAPFWKGAAERGLKTFVQTTIAVTIASVGAEAVGTTAGILDVSWLNVLSVSALATVLSLGTSLGNSDFVAGGPGTEIVPPDTDFDEDEEDEDEVDPDDPEDLEITEVTYPPVSGDDAGAYVDATDTPRHGQE